MVLKLDQGYIYRYNSSQAPSGLGKRSLDSEFLTLTGPGFNEAPPGKEFSPGSPILCLTVMNVGEAISYLSSIRFKVYRQDKISYIRMTYPPSEIDPLVNPDMGEPIEPGLSETFRFSLMLFQTAKERGDFFLDSVEVCDQVDNIYSLRISDQICEFLKFYDSI